MTFTELSLVPANDPALTKVSCQVSNAETQVVPFLKAMRKLMRAHKGVGLSAPQIGLNLCFFITDVPGAHTVINPAIVHLGGSRVSATEGCLSKPGYRTFVARHTELILRFYDPRWKLHERLFTGHAARVLQHEIDHLNGICIFKA